MFLIVLGIFFPKIKQIRLFLKYKAEKEAHLNLKWLFSYAFTPDMVLIDPKSYDDSNMT